LRAVVAGGEAAGQRVLRSVAATHDVVAVFAGSGPAGAPVRAEAERLGLAVLEAKRVKDATVPAEVGAIDLFLNVHNLYVVTPELLTWPRLGAYNVHPGWLPDFAGRNCPSWAVWMGEPEPGVTVHLMHPDVDRGPVAFQERFPAGDAPTGGSVAIECAKRGIRLVDQLVAGLLAGDLELEEQDTSKFRYFGREVPNDGVLDFTHSAADVERFVRACDYGPFHSPWGVPRTWGGGHEIGVRRAVATDQDADRRPGTIRHGPDGVEVACADTWLELRAVTLDGVPTDPAAALSGISRLGEGE
jgi:UDP-4-amino-4-deoxy-L-arabinose formyltransferase/UDP-glucuronic acid dehydrogenase (UDP-4-keto-hexauronic acid decarboxylating)